MEEQTRRGNAARDPALRELGEAQKKLRDNEAELRGLRAEIFDRAAAAVEASHRNANALQLAIAFVRLGRKKIADEQSRSLLDATISRLEALARLQRRLKTRGDRERIALDDYLRELSGDMAAAFGLSCTARCDPLSVEVQLASALALVLNELVINAAKHAYDGEGGRFSVDARADGKSLCVEARDFGRGIVGDLDPNADSLGFRIVRSLVQQRGGQLTLKSDGGLIVSMIFPGSCLSNAQPSSRSNSVSEIP
ncbi:MAG TPA: sensor histidine kinase [Rhizomicrobium sp.]|nr:sensor histidine kinase [Rhizomicrobium sp.]